MLTDANYHLSPAAEIAFREEVARQMDQPGFANARSVRNDLDRARLRHAHRLAADAARLWTRDELMRLEADDVVEDDLRLVLNPSGGSATIPGSAPGFTSPER
jgi:hypothetical protein